MKLSQHLRNGITQSEDCNYFTISMHNGKCQTCALGAILQSAEPELFNTIVDYYINNLYFGHNFSIEFIVHMNDENPYNNLNLEEELKHHFPDLNKDVNFIEADYFIDLSEEVKNKLRSYVRGRGFPISLSEFIYTFNDFRDVTRNDVADVLEAMGY